MTYTLQQLNVTLVLSHNTETTLHTLDLMVSNIIIRTESFTVMMVLLPSVQMAINIIIRTESFTVMMVLLSSVQMVIKNIGRTESNCLNKSSRHRKRHATAKPLKSKALNIA